MGSPQLRPADELEEANRRLASALEQAQQQLVLTVERLNATQAQLIQAEKLSALGELVAGVAHELNNPLTSVIGYAQLLREELEAADGVPPRPPAELTQDLQHICHEGERAARIVRSLLAFAARQVGARHPAYLPDLVEPVLALRRYARRLDGIDISLSVAPSIPRILADGPQIQQVLVNLLLNAEHSVRAIGGSRRIALTIEFEPRSHALRLDVSDNGHGIDPGHLTRVFDPFFTTRQDGAGTGLGLSVCYGIVRDHGGEIDVESVPFRQTTFSVRLPALPPDPQPDQLIAIVHRDRDTSGYLAAILRGWGFRCDVVTPLERGAEAIADGAVAAFVDPDAIPDLLDRTRAALEASGARLVLLGDRAQTPGPARAALAGFRASAQGELRPPYRLETLRAALTAVGLADAEEIA